MSERVLPSTGSLPSVVASRLHQLCSRFEAAWEGNNPPRVEDYLADTPEPGRAVLLGELLRLELAFRIRAGERPVPEDYQARFPEHAVVIAAAFSAAEPVREPTDTWPPAAADGTNDLPAQLGRYGITAQLGSGAFGVVYKGYDDDLRRDVAIKVPHRKRVAGPEGAEAYLAEARILARLDHPGIVPVHDFGRTDDGLCYLVSKFVEGSDLADRLDQGRPSAAEAAEIVARVAEALHHAHQHGLVHRDIKPANILLDAQGNPVVADFGLALREEDFGTGPTFAGTPAYMSPEQARGEGHRVDARTDIYSLGAVFYKLLTGRLPFDGPRMDAILEQIKSQEPRPPRQLDDAIPKELDRICLKALSKRAADRYSTARDFADDLHHWQAGDKQPPAVQVQVVLPAGTGAAAPPPATVSVAADTDQRPVQIIPRGLRSFDAADASFFLQLLPGPRDRDGLPDSLRFWKSRIEEPDPDKTFTVGLIYGPSGCGKSSLVKAGLLPRLASEVRTVYVEATAADTEARLLKGLRKQCAELPADLGLVASLAHLRRGLPVGRIGNPSYESHKVLLVLDQFEQWLHARRQEEDTELVQALRQCDGGRVQCIVMVRDDFWLAVSRFMTALEVELVQGQNMALADLFDLTHARKVLAEFGRSFGRLPDNLGTLTREQEMFLDQAVAGLAQDGRVISVRLALFAEMVKGRPWTPTTLKEVGGAAGVGVAFLEETFSSPAASPPHRLHQLAARAVLKALLPEQGTDIKGNMRSREALQRASGYTDRPRDFDQLLRILDGELRLVTPTDTEALEAEPTPTRSVSEGSAAASLTLRVGVGARYYQLTHDYLVPSLRDWLTRKQRETRRGRAELRLADRAALWQAKPQNRHLPASWEWANIRLLTQKKDWTSPQYTMMRQAARFHGVRLAGLLLLLAVLGWGGYEGHGRLQAQVLRGRLFDATTSDVPAIVDEMAPYRRWLDPRLHDAYAEAEAGKDARKQLHASLALLPVDATQVDYLYGRLLAAEPQEVLVIRRALLAHQAEVSERLWTVLRDRQADLEVRLRAACALALYTREDPRWEMVSGDVAARLVIQNPFVLGTWAEALRPVAPSLLPPLASFIEDEKRTGSERSVIANLYKTFAEGQPAAFARLETVLAEESKADAAEKDKVALVKRQANAGVALAVMGRGDKVWPLLKHSPDPTLRSFLIDRLAPAGVDPKVLLTRFDEEPDVSIRRALLLSVGEFGGDRLPLVEQQNFMPRLVEIYRVHPDPGIHGAAAWLLRHWQAESQVKEIDKKLQTGKVADKRRWYINGQGQTMVVVREPGEFWMGEGQERKQQRINYNYAIAAREVTVEQFLHFRKDERHSKQSAPSDDCPMMEVSWYDAAAYCNWLSGREGIPPDQWCYEPADKGEIKTVANHLQRTGYRLPTEAEWEYACRAGADTGYCYGEPDELLGKYAWFVLNSVGKSHSAGLLKPNDLGLFDMHGNASEWCDDLFSSLGGSDRVFRGGGWNFHGSDCRAAFRFRYSPSNRFLNLGFRLARVSVGKEGE